ncbi:MAG TPA: type II secretion system F family protein [Candidatus Paceibacterota bacterium]|nr:type II secretion system F family protein [Candidatus Paceibacterota bacterium]
MLRGRGGRFSLKEQVHFAKRLSFLMEAGVPLADGLAMLEAQANKRGSVLGSVARDVTSGQALWRSMARFPRAFSDLAVSIVRVGEESGGLSESLAYLADELKKRQMLRGRLIGAFVYPAAVAAATLGIVLFLVLYLFPKLIPVFNSLHAELPFTTRAIIGLSFFLEQWGLWALLAIAVLAAGAALLLRQSERLRLLRDACALRIPIAGPLLVDYHAAGIARTLGLLLKSGLTLSEAIRLTARTVRNLAYRRGLASLAYAVERGEPVSVRLGAQAALFPAMFSQMLEVAERSGSLPDTLLYLSDLYEREVEEYAKNLSTLLEPALMVTMGLVVGFIAVSIITPIYGITQNLHG